jgi:hypothetical protein
VKRVLIAAAALGLVLTGCTSEADTVSDNISKDADSFKVVRRIVFYNGITGNYILEVEGRCSLGNFDKNGELSVTCKTGEDEYKKHFLGLSDKSTIATTSPCLTTARSCGGAIPSRTAAVCGGTTNCPTSSELWPSRCSASA